VWLEHSQRRHAAVEAEIDGERGAALGRAGRKLEAQFERCQALAADLDAAPDGPDADAALAAYREARDEFEQLRWSYQVHREALNLLDHRWIDRHYPLPPRR
jgi:hypothetical protein